MKSNKKLNKHLSKVMKRTSPKYSWQRIPDDCGKLGTPYFDKWNKQSDKDFNKEVQFNKRNEISVVRVALLKDGTFTEDEAHCDPYFVYAAAQLLKDNYENEIRGDD